MSKRKPPTPRLASRKRAGKVRAARAARAAPPALRGRPDPLSSNLAFHAYADAFPLIGGGELRALVDDIKAHGLHDPIVLFQGKILDGRNRYRACMAAGVPPRTIDYAGDDPLAFVVSCNLRRRHLNASQRAMAAAKLRRAAKAGRPCRDEPGLPTARVAELLNTSDRSVERAVAVVEGGVAELQQAVEQGTVAVSTAAVLADLPEGEQLELVARGEQEILAAAKRIRAEKTERRRLERVERIKVAAAGELGADGRRYPVLYVDPPWRYDFGDSDRSVENNYPTMTIDEICALPVRDLATEVAILFLWIPASIRNRDNGRDFTRVIEAWGFESKSEIVWDKEWPITGKRVRGQHELLIVCTRGDMPLPPTSAVPTSIYRERRSDEHSEKPVAFYPMIELMYPDLPRIELFARQRRFGWDVWGNQAPAEATT